MGIYAWIKKTDSQIADYWADTPVYFCLSPTRLSLTRKLLPQIRNFCSGRCLDAGAGRSAYERELQKCSEEYISVDIQARPSLLVQGSILDLPVRKSCMDTVFCSQVLEHVPDPEGALREFYSCLKPGGVLLLTTPHLAYLHNEPHDYFRYTKHGLRVLLERTGYEIISIQPAGGLLSFLTHIPSMIFKAIFYKIPLISKFVIIVNALISLCVVWVDERIDIKKLFALNYIAVAKKPEVASKQSVSM